MALTIAGSDPSGGAGIQADLRVFSAQDVYGFTVITALTAQNFDEVSAIMGVTEEFVKAQLETLKRALPISALKTGMLWSTETVNVVAKWIGVNQLRAVVDPVMVSTSGDRLVSNEAIEAYKSVLLP